MRLIFRVALPVLAIVAVACSDPNQLLPASQRNFEDTVTVFALHGTPVQSPSGYSVPDGPVRTDRTSSFDFAYDVTVSGVDTTRYFLPQKVLDLAVNNSVNPGLQLRAQTFESIVDAPSNGYITEDSLPLSLHQVYIVRSRLVCQIGVSLYSKLEIIAFDDAARSVQFRVLANINCGYKRLQPGLPTK
ncbi:MAG: hypothetical protein ABI613_05815 [Gemmatimonadota bacterium]